jgi:transposase
MTTKTRKTRISFSPAQKNEYAKLMVEENYTNKQIMDLSGAGASAVIRWKKQYLAEQKGEEVKGRIPLDADKRRIKELEAQLADSKEDVRLLKKPHYYQGGKQKPNIPNLLERKFDQQEPNTHWVGDITYIRSHQGWSYLATVLDLATREIVGYALSQTPESLS